MSSQTEAPAADKKIHRYPCPGCSADLVFEPKNGALSCPYCGRTETLPQSDEEVNERSYEDYLHAQQSQMATLAPEALEVSCGGCGATTTFAPGEVANVCPFCGGTIVTQPRAADPLVAPEGVLPFHVTQVQAQKEITAWIKSRWFAPNALKHLAYQHEIGSVYLPYWTYDAHTTSPYSGQRGDYYYESESYTETDSQGRRVTKTRQVRKTRWRHASGTVSRWFDDVLVPAINSISSDSLHVLEPWDLPEIKNYDPSYLSGHRAQRYELDLAAGFEHARGRMDPQIRSDICRDIGGDVQQISTYKTAYSGITFKHILLPVYISAYRFRDKVFQVMVNARTCEVTGERPYSYWKISLFSIAMLILAIVVFSIANNY